MPAQVDPARPGGTRRPASLGRRLHQQQGAEAALHWRSWVRCEAVLCSGHVPGRVGPPVPLALWHKDAEGGDQAG